MSNSQERIEDQESSSKIKFQKKNVRKSRNVRQRRKSDDSSEDEDDTNKRSTNNEKIISKLEETKEKQKLRKKPNGVNIIGLALGKKITLDEEVTNKDPFNTKTGGMINLHALKTGKTKPVDDAYDVGIGTQFSAETNKRDEDEEMMKYIEEQLSKRKGIINEKPDENLINSIKYLSPEEAALLALPDHLRTGSTQRSEEMLSNQMLNGIPEVDLGIEAKIRNIEATEEAKEKLLLEQKNKMDGPSHFVPTNMAVNFVQHNRFNIEEADAKRRKQHHHHNHHHQQRHPHEHNSAAAGGNQNKGGIKKATDDYHYDKFKKQFRRH